VLSFYGLFCAFPVVWFLHRLAWRHLLHPLIPPASRWRAPACWGWMGVSLVISHVMVSIYWVAEAINTVLAGVGSAGPPFTGPVADAYASAYHYWSIAWIAFLVACALRRDGLGLTSPRAQAWLRHSLWALPLIAIVTYGGWNTMSSYRATASQQRQDRMLRLAFTCTHEADHLPPLDPQADELFNYARYLQKKKGPKDFNAMARYYRIAAAYGHYKANHNLQLLVSQGFADSPSRPTETIALVHQLIQDGIPSGYYDMGHYLQLGYGVDQSEELALRYYRKAADMGSPEAQFYVAKRLAPIDIAPDIARQMQQCAAAQGHGEAANSLGFDLQTDKHYADATRAFQQGVAAGNTLSALMLEKGFNGVLPSDELNYLALPNDPERSRRYKLIGAFIDANYRRNPKVPDIDQIVPLPPAPLPEWDGTFQWQKEQTHIPPQPSDELIERLSKAKHLDPATGLPLPPPPRTAIGTRLKTGTLCPEAGVWCVRGPSGDIVQEQMFWKGLRLPVHSLYRPRGLGFLNPLLDYLLGERYEHKVAIWELRRWDDATS